MKTENTHPLILGAAAAVLVTCAIAVASMTGYLPESKADGFEGKQVALEQTEATTSNRSDGKNQESTIDSEKVSKSVAPKTAPLPSKSNYSNTNRYEPSRSAYQKASYCGTCGQVSQVRQVQSRGEGTGVGAVAGGVTGAVIGKQFGNGKGQKAMTVIGAIGGAILGNNIEKNVRGKIVYEVTVAFNDGSSGTFKFDTPPQWQSGDRVKVVNGHLMANL